MPNVDSMRGRLLDRGLIYRSSRGLYEYALPLRHPRTSVQQFMRSGGRGSEMCADRSPNAFYTAVCRPGERA
jgi:hypothetical protein